MQPRTAVLNGVLATASAGFAVAALIRPAAMAPDGDSSSYYARMYAARAIPLGVLVALRSRDLANGAALTRGDRTLLTVAGLAQLADAAIGVLARQPGQVIAPAAAAAIHLRAARSPHPGGE